MGISTPASRWAVLIEDSFISQRFSGATDNHRDDLVVGGGLREWDPIDSTTLLISCLRAFLDSCCLAGGRRRSSLRETDQEDVQVERGCRDVSSDQSTTKLLVLLFLLRLYIVGFLLGRGQHKGVIHYRSGQRWSGVELLSGV